MKRLTYSNSMQKRRHRHKLILPLWCILLLVTGCGNLYTGDESLYDPNHQDNQGDQTQLPVMVAFSDPIYNVLTRGAGVLNPTDETNFSKRIADGTFFVYAFRRDNPNGMTYAHRRAEDADRRYCLIDGSLDEISAEECTALGLTAEQCKLHGKRAAYAGNGSFINWKSSGYIPYYNLQEEFDAFNFFAYYYDNAQVGEVKREADRICFDVTVDGSQDLMCAAAADLKALIEDVENGRKIAADYSEQAARLKQLGADERQLMRSCYYGTYTARRNIWPIMAQLRFSVIPATEQSEEDRTAVQNMKVKNITIKNHGTTATLNVLTGKLTFTDNGSLLMREATDDGKGNITFTDDNADGTVEVPKDIYVQKYEGGQYMLNGVSSANPLIQGYLMVKPDMEQFLMDVTIMAPDASGVPQDLIVRDIPVNAPAPAVDSGKSDNLFYAGYYYNVRIGIYATQQINATATLATWKPGGDSVDVPIE